jgi:hypothetical protein
LVMTVGILPNLIVFYTQSYYSLPLKVGLIIYHLSVWQLNKIVYKTELD